MFEITERGGGPAAVFADDDEDKFHVEKWLNCLAIVREHDGAYLLMAGRDLARKLARVFDLYARDGSLDRLADVTEDRPPQQQDIRDRVEEIAGDLDGHERRIAATETAVATLERRADGLCRSANGQLNQTTDMAADLIKAGERMDGIDRRIADLEVDIKAVHQGLIYVNGPRGLCGTVTDLGGKVEALEQRIDDIGRDMVMGINGLADRLKVVEGWQRNRDKERQDSTLEQRTAAVEDRAAKNKDHIDNIHGTPKSLLAVAESVGLKPAENTTKTPQQTADELSERFPIGTPVNFFERGSDTMRSGIIYGRFSAASDGPVVQVVGAFNPILYTADRIGLASWTK